MGTVGIVGTWKWMSVLLIACGCFAAIMVSAGCNDVMLSAKYNRLLDQTADLSAETASRAQAGTLPAADMAISLKYQAYVWRQFVNGRDGVESDPLPTTQPTTQPVLLVDLVTPPVACK